MKNKKPQSGVEQKEPKQSHQNMFLRTKSYLNNIEALYLFSANTKDEALINWTDPNLKL